MMSLSPNNPLKNSQQPGPAAQAEAAQRASKPTSINIGRNVQSVVCGTPGQAGALQRPGQVLKSAVATPDAAELAKREYERGVAAGLAQARRETAALTQALQAAIQQAQRQSLDVQNKLDQHATTLALHIAAKIVGREVKDMRTAQSMIAQALAQAPMKRGLKIRLNPQDAGMLQQLRESGEPSVVKVPDDAEFIADSSVSKGGCVIESMLGRIDARVETQLELMARALSDSATGAEPKNV
jgi:flagellar assembly protein FliH